MCSLCLRPCRDDGLVDEVTEDDTGMLGEVRELSADSVMSHGLDRGDSDNGDGE